MSVTVDKDCITLKDGNMLCWDDDDKCYYVLTKKKVDVSDVLPKDLTRLVAHLSGQITRSRNV